MITGENSGTMNEKNAVAGLRDRGAATVSAMIHPRRAQGHRRATLATSSCGTHRAGGARKSRHTSDSPRRTTPPPLMTTSIPSSRSRHTSLVHWRAQGDTGDEHDLHERNQADASYLASMSCHGRTVA